MFNTNRVIRNASWIVGCKMIRALLSLIVGMFTARYLGPSGYGVIAFAGAMTAFAEPIMNLGYKQILPNEFVTSPEREGEILGSTILFSVVSALCCIAGVVTVAALMDPADNQTIIACGLYSILLIFNACELTKYWFQTKLLSKYPSVVILIAYICVSIYKVALLISKRNLYWFAVSNAVEEFIIAAGMFIAYRRLKGPKLSFSWRTGWQILQRSKHFILPAMMISLLQQTDRIMIREMMSIDYTGLYSAALACSGVLGFVYQAVIDSAQPSILTSKLHRADEYQAKLKHLYSVVFYLTLAQGIGVCLLAEPLISLIYGGAFLPAVPALRVVTWQTVFTYLGCVRQVWILAENQQKHLWMINLCGVLTNAGLNAILIPIGGIVGAAASTLMTQFTMNLVLGFLLRPFRENNVLMLAAMHPKNLWSAMKSMIE